MTDVASQGALRRSPLHQEHEALGATFTPFGQWDMPLKYGSELEEHRAVRTTVGLFDLSHMGEIRVTGAQAGEFLDYALISQLSTIKVHKAKYSMIVNEQGGIIDDLISYRLGDQEYLVIPNAGNAETVFAAFNERAADFRAQGNDVQVADESADTALIAVQGPQAEALLLTLAPEAHHATITDMGYYACAPAHIAGHDVLLARTGYTGEDGFELYIGNADAPDLWQAIYTAGQAEEFGLKPAGLAARDSLRLEAGMPLYGNELSLDHTPFDAGLGVLIGKKKEGDWVGKLALEQAPESARVLVGLTSQQRRAARAGADLLNQDDQVVGTVTSGQPSPTLGIPVALAYVDRALSEPGTELIADIRGKQYPFTVVALPFYSRSK